MNDTRHPNDDHRLPEPDPATVRPDAQADPEACDSTLSFRGDTDRYESDTLPLATGAALQRIDDFELLELIGRGGMGLVYKARQVSLRRDVALKLIRSGEFATDEERQRFQAEAEAAGGLHHPAIVPVYASGQYAGGSYYAMEYVAGTSLATRLADGPLPSREAAGILLRVAQALAHAHAQQVIHRDLKPGNILLDAQGKPRLTDFGLARRLDAEDQLTRSGQVLGTPSYMPPEQALGQRDRVDQRSDIYSLGAVLYASLTGKPPFQAAGVAATLRLVLESDPVTPRTLNPTIDRDLETICLKCLEMDPAARYQSAVMVEQELERYLDGRPILARPVSLPQRVRKWARRRPLVAGLVATILMLLLAGAAGAWQAYREVVFQRDLARTNAAQAEEAAVETAEALNLVVFDVYHELVDMPGTDELRMKLLSETRSRLDSLANRYPDLPKVQLGIIKTQLDTGDGYQDAGRTADAAEIFQQARELGRDLAERYPDWELFRVAELTAALKLAMVHDWLGNLQQAYELFQEVQAGADRLPSDYREVLDLRYTVSVYQGTLHRYRGESEQAEACYRRALELVDRLPEATGRSAVERAPCHLALADLLATVGQPDQALQLGEAALATFEAAYSERPKSIEASANLVSARTTVGRIHYVRQAYQPALELLQQAVSLCREMVQRDPNNMEHWQKLSVALTSLGQAYGALGDLSQTELAMRESLELSDRLMNDDPENTERRFDFLMTCYHLARLNFSRPQVESARQWLDRGKAELDRLADAGRLEQILTFFAEVEAMCAAYDRSLADSSALEEERNVDVLNAVLLELARRGDAQRLLNASNRLLALPAETEQHRYNVAVVHVEAAEVLSGPKAADDGQSSAPAQLQEELVQRALRVLGELSASGFFQRADFKTLLQREACWDPIRSREEFRQLEAGE